MVDARVLKSFLRPASFIAIAWSIFQLYAIAAGFLHPMLFYPVHVTFAVSLAFLHYPTCRDGKTYKFLDTLFVLFTFSIGIYIVLNFQRFSSRIPFVHSPTPMDILFGLSLIVILLEACRRIVGWSLTLVALICIAYAFAGKYMPGLLSHRGLSIERFVDLQVLSPNGIFGLPIGVSAEVVFYFILFGAFLERSGGGELFSDIAYSISGRVRGGAAKASVVSSALYGTISGSAVANVVVDGMFTIPLMKRSGFNPPFAAAVEAVASTGGQIMPPVMGAAAFILAQIVGISYKEVAIAAIIPAILYYLALYFAIDFESAKKRFRGLTRAELPDVMRGLKLRIHLVIPLITIVYYIISGTVTPVTAAFRAIMITVLISFLRKATRMGPIKLLYALEKGGREAINVAIPCAVAGVVIGIVINSGLGLKFTDLMIYFSGGILIVAMVLVMVACIILGMGMPTSAAYLMAAILMAPALINLGVIPIAAHMFIFYFAVISMITPPVALAAYAAAAISESDLWETGLVAFKLALPGFLIPYVFLYNNGLLLRGALSDIIWVTVTTAIGIIGLAGATAGYFVRSATILERIFLALGATLLIVPEKTTDFIGVSILICIFILQKTKTVMRIDGAVQADNAGTSEKIQSITKKGSKP